MVGSVVRAINSGLGNLSWEFYRHGLIDKCIIVDDGKHDELFPERFGQNILLSKLPLSKRDMDWLLADIETLLIFETPYNWELMYLARKKGIKIVYMPMHEFPPQDNNADIWLCPSELEMNMPLNGTKVRLNVPVALDKITWRQRDRAVSFVHNAGGGGILGRNGTNELITALKHTTTDFDMTIRSQSYNYEVVDSRLTVLHENIPSYEDLYKYGDVFILPDKFAGLSLPLQEAYASGMLVMTTDRYPLNDWLPTEPLIPVESIGSSGAFDVSIINPQDISETIDTWYNKDITEYSLRGKEWGEANSWEVLLPIYKKILYDK